MQIESYPVETEQLLVFTFTSEGKNGKIDKIIRYDLVKYGIYNLAFGDRIGNTLDLDDRSSSNNGDIRKVMATVIQTLPIFFSIHVDKVVYFQGIDDRRMKLYSRIIRMYASEWKDVFEIRGITSKGTVESFKETESYFALIINKIRVV